MIKTIIFDLGGVYFTDGTKRAIIDISRDYGIDQNMVRDVLNGELGNGYRKGKITGDEFWEKAGKELSISDSTDKLKMSWLRSYEPNIGTVRIIEKLKDNGYELLFLSDNIKERAEYLESRYHFLKNFREGVFSHKVGMRKTDGKEIYELVLAKTECKAGECVYIDDKERLLGQAQNLGMKTVLFISPDKLKESLESLEVNTS